MDIAIEKILRRLSNMSQDEMDTICDLRDREEFETKWNEVFDMLEYDTLPYHPNQKESFIKMSNCTSGHEITEYISDDFDLIYNANKKGISTPFLEQLKSNYANSEIPQ